MMHFFLPFRLIERLVGGLVGVEKRCVAFAAGYAYAAGNVVLSFNGQPGNASAQGFGCFQHFFPCNVFCKNGKFVTAEAADKVVVAEVRV